MVAEPEAQFARTAGWDRIRRSYPPRFAPGARRDDLRFEEFALRQPAPEGMLATTRFVLYRGGRTTADAPFTLVMRRLEEGWRILHDHSSAD